MTTVAVDHVIFVVDDLDDASTLLWQEHGLASIPGGHHAGHGTANRIVPLGDSYLELMAVADEAEAAGSAMGRWALSRRTAALVPVGLCLRTDDADAEAARLGLTPMAMSRARPDGVVLSWRLVGADEMFGRGLPFFIQWDDIALHPGRSAADHRQPVSGIEHVVVCGDLAALTWRIGRDMTTVAIAAGDPEVCRVTIGTGTRAIALGR